jgi:hypothetical protein
LPCSKTPQRCASGRPSPQRDGRRRAAVRCRSREGRDRLAWLWTGPACWWLPCTENGGSPAGKDPELATPGSVAARFANGGTASEHGICLPICALLLTVRSEVSTRWSIAQHVCRVSDAGRSHERRRRPCRARNGVSAAASDNCMRYARSPGHLLICVIASRRGLAPSSRSRLV